MRQKFAQMFRTIAEIVDTRETPESMLDLSKDQIRQLKDLRYTDEWPTFLTALDRVGIVYGEAMLASTSEQEMFERKGYILGLRRAGTLVDEILSADKEKTEQDERSRSGAERATDHRDTALYATPGWGARK